MTQKQHRHHVHHLKNKWIAKHRDLHKNLWEKHQDSLEWLEQQSKNAVVGSLAGLIMLTQPMMSSLSPMNFHSSTHLVEEHPIDSKTQLLTALSSLLPPVVQPLTQEQEQSIAEMFSHYFRIPIKAELHGIRLNRNYGLIGAEQHLMRYPGDTIATHFDTPNEAFFSRSGMAPGRGAWGYFAPTQTVLSEQDKLREKYYIAVPTFLAPGYMDNVKEQYAFFKHRKMLVVNPENGKAMVVVIGDSGPGVSTGKHLGGSPEVMAYLERKDGRAKGPVLYFFIDDPNDTIPLGPIESRGVLASGH
jgi:hypothetical protein